jgi:hypothetical protein
VLFGEAMARIGGKLPANLGECLLVYMLLATGDELTEIVSRDMAKRRLVASTKAVRLIAEASLIVPMAHTPPQPAPPTLACALVEFRHQQEIDYSTWAPVYFEIEGMGVGYLEGDPYLRYPSPEIRFPPEIRLLLLQRLGENAAEKEKEMLRLEQQPGFVKALLEFLTRKECNVCGKAATR